MQQITPPPPSPPPATYYSPQPGNNQFPAQQLNSPSLTSLSPGNVYYENDQKQVTLECKESKEEEPNYKDLYARLKIRSAAAGLEF